MMYSSQSHHVEFYCLDDALWTVSDGSDDLLSFLDCARALFEEVYLKSLARLISQPKDPHLSETQLVQVYGIPCILSAQKQGKSWSVCLDRIPFVTCSLGTDLHQLGLFRFSGGTVLQWANDRFYELLGLQRDAFASEYSNDLCGVGPRFTSLPQLGYLYDEQTNLLFFANPHAGFCSPLPENTTLYTYRKALQTNGMRVWQYDLASRSLMGFQAPPTYLNHLEGLHALLHAGQNTCSATFYLEDDGRYVSVQYHKSGSVAFAVEQDISSYTKRLRFQFFEDHLKDNELLPLQRVVKADLTEDSLFYTRNNDRGGGDEHYSQKTYSEVFDSIINSIAFDEDKQLFAQKFSPDALLAAYEGGQSERSLEYRSFDEGGNILWFESRMLLHREQENHHLLALGTSRYITGKKRIELSLAGKATRDPASGFYDRPTFFQMVDLSLKIGGEEGIDSYALAIIELQGIGAQSLTLFSLISQVFRLGLNERCIVGRLDFNHFALFFEKVVNKVQMRIKLARLANMLTNASLYVPIVQNLNTFLGFTTGRYREDSSCALLLEEASLALDKAHERGRNQVVAYAWEDEENPDTVRPLNLLDSHAQGVVFGCMDATLSSDDLSSTMPLVLSQVGLYYASRRVCLLTQEKGGALEVAANWEPGPSSGPLPSLPYDPFLTLFEKQEVKKLAVPDLDREFPCLDGSTLLVGNLQVWGMQRCYLVVLDPSSDDFSVLAHSVQLISSEMTKRRLFERQEYLVYHDSVTGLKNFHGYNQYISTLVEDSLSSIALAIVDVNDLKEINKHHGKEYANKIIALVVQLLKRYFPKGHLFRISSHEFLAIRHDITYKGFCHKVERLASDLSQNYPRMTTIAQAWSEKNMQITVLYNQASMELEANRKNALDLSNPREHYQAFDDLTSSIQRGEYLVYLQPKFCSTTRAVCGSEALIRHLHPSHGLTSPSKFIPQLEQDGLIKYIDLFVFEEVCKTLKRWKEGGERLLPISLNFSRLTLLDENLIPLMEEIRSRNSVESRFVEIEITESFGALDRNLVKKVVEDIDQAGYCVCIDDFGSEYSNLSTLTSLPLGVLKLDKSLIDSMSSSKKGQVFVDGFINICKNLGVKTVAEGVETEAQFDLMKAMGCDMIQGYFFDKPLSISSFEQKYLPM